MERVYSYNPEARTGPTTTSGFCLTGQFLQITPGWSPRVFQTGTSGDRWRCKIVSRLDAPRVS